MVFFAKEKSAISHLDLCAKFLKKVEMQVGSSWLVQALLMKVYAI